MEPHLIQNKLSVRHKLLEIEIFRQNILLGLTALLLASNKL